MYNLFFEDVAYQRHLVAEKIEKDNLTSKVYEDMAQRAPNFKIYYVRSWMNDDKEIYMDFGSHSCFYVAVPLS